MLFDKQGKAGGSLAGAAERTDDQAFRCVGAEIEDESRKAITEPPGIVNKEHIGRLGAHRVANSPNAERRMGTDDSNRAPGRGKL